MSRPFEPPRNGPLAAFSRPSPQRSADRARMDLARASSDSELGMVPGSELGFGFVRMCSASSSPGSARFTLEKKELPMFGQTRSMNRRRNPAPLLMGRRYSGATAAGVRSSQTPSTLRCWGPSWDRSCRLCLPMPTPGNRGATSCVSFKAAAQAGARRSGMFRAAAAARSPFAGASLGLSGPRPSASLAPTCDPKTCKWICLPMPRPGDPNDEHCVPVPRQAQLSGAYVSAR